MAMLTCRGRLFLAFFICALQALILCSCTAERRKSDAELGLNPEQAMGRKIYDSYCYRCHEPYSSADKKGPSLQNVFKRQYLEKSGLPATNERVGAIIVSGRNMMPGFGQVLDEQQVQHLLAYLHTL